MQTGHEGLSLSQRATHAAWKVCAHAGRMLSSSPAMHGVAGWLHKVWQVGSTVPSTQAHLTLTLTLPLPLPLTTSSGLTLRVLLLAHDAQRVLPLEGILLAEEGAPGQG